MMSDRSLSILGYSGKVYVNRLDLIEMAQTYFTESDDKSQKKTFLQIVKLMTEMGEPPASDEGDSYTLHVLDTKIDCVCGPDGVYLRILDLMGLLIRGKTIDLAIRTMILGLINCLQIAETREEKDE